MCYASVFRSFPYLQEYSRPLIKFNVFELTQFWNKFLLESVSFSVGKNTSGFYLSRIFRNVNIGNLLLFLEILD